MERIKREDRAPVHVVIPFPSRWRAHIEMCSRGSCCEQSVAFSVSSSAWLFINARGLFVKENSTSAHADGIEVEH